MKFILLITLFTAPCWALKSQIDILSVVVVESDKVFLKDIIQNKFLPSELEDIFSKIEIGESPKAGEGQKYTNYAISEIIRYNLKLNKREDVLDNFQLKIPNVVSVSRKTNDITSDQVKKELLAKLKAKCDSCEFEIFYFKFQDLKDLEPGLTWQLSDMVTIPRGYANLGIDISRNQTLVKKVYAQGNIRIYKNVPVLKRPLSAGVKIQKDDFEWQKKDLTFANDSYPKENEIIGAELASYLNVSEAITQKHIKRKFALQRGMPVQVVIRNVAWRAQMSAVAQDNGYVGDVVKVQNPITKKIITGVVTDENQVEVQ